MTLARPINTELPRNQQKSWGWKLDSFYSMLIDSSASMTKNFYCNPLGDI